jgi:hypothetical protein
MKPNRTLLFLVLYFSSLFSNADAKGLKKLFLSARTALTNSHAGPGVRKLSQNVAATSELWIPEG